MITEGVQGKLWGTGKAGLGVVRGIGASMSEKVKQEFRKPV